MTQPTIPTTMRALRLHEPVGPRGLQLDQVAVPVPGRGEALIQVQAAALTRDELTWPVDRLPAIPSYEVAGTVAAVGEGVDLSVGTSVFGLTPFDRDGVAADFALVPANTIGSAPSTVDAVHAASLPLPALTAYQALVTHGGVQEGERVLVSGAAGGVGQFVTQLAKINRASVTGTASASGRDLAFDLGADEVIDPQQSFDGIEAVDLVIDTIGGDVVERAAQHVRPGGRLVSIFAEPPTVIDSSISTHFFVVEANGEQLDQITRLVDAGELSTAIDSTFPLTEAVDAFTRAQSPGKRGKVVLVISDG